MGVEQGYSKIATSGLVFAYDTGDTVNSYIGEPTTNLANFDIASSGFGSDTSGNLTQTSNSSEATYRGRLSRKMVVGAGYWNAYVFDYNTGVSSAVFAVSYKVKTADGSHPNTIIGGGYIYGSAGSFFPTPTFTYLSDGWYLATMLYAGSSMVLNSLTGMNGSGGPKTFYIIDYQAEAKTHSTPFAGVAGTRSNTQGLLDISGTGTSINLANVSFNANAQYYFDGTDDYINFGNVSAGMAGASQATMELVINMTFPSAYQQIFGFRDDNQFDFFFLAFSGGSSEFRVRNSAGTYYDLNPNLSSYAGKPTHIVFCVGPEGRKVYANGVLIASNATWTGNLAGASPFNIGRNAGNYWFATGAMPVAKLYTKQLTANEILGNFNHYKTRFNIT